MWENKTVHIAFNYYCYFYVSFSSVQFSCLVVSDPFDPIDCSSPGFPVHHQLSEPTQTHVHWVGDAIQPSHPLSSPPPIFNLPKCLLLCPYSFSVFPKHFYKKFLLGKKKFLLCHPLMINSLRFVNMQKHIQFSSVAQSCPTLCNPMNHSMPGLPVHHKLPEFTQTHVHRVGDAIQPSHPLLSPSPPAPSILKAY